MSKTFTDKPLHQFDQVKYDNVSWNLDKHLDQFNGGLDSNNLPVASVGEAKLVEPSPAGSTYSGPVTQWGYTMPSQAYYFTRRAQSSEGGGDIWTPLFEIDLDQDTWSAGFNKLVDLDNNFINFPLLFNAKEGMLVGCATIDWEHGNQVFNVNVGGDPPVNAPRGRGNEWWSEWAVFVNNVLVARTGEIFPRRHTTQLPFAVACGSQPVQIDVRCKINTWRVSGSPNLDTTSMPFKLFGATIWTRNHYR